MANTDNYENYSSYEQIQHRITDNPVRIIWIAAPGNSGSIWKNEDDLWQGEYIKVGRVGPLQVNPADGDSD
ncbi:MAG: hypothetical protein HZC54_12575 [Verrucomicrobia bacterium]|nr:hypothetical protein [Verrucomicrobiota bacterium]